jgi:predicted RNA-binding Zn-ribbon protein involved in translation (DUF1610 family)
VDPLDRLFQELVRAAQQAGALHRPIAIREILEDLLPYRVVRPLRIAELLDDYRQLVMRLVAGERTLLEADPEVRAACSAALESRHPDLSLLETYGDRLVTVVTAAIVERPSVPAFLEPDTAPRLVDTPSVPHAVLPTVVAPSVPPIVEPASAPMVMEPASVTPIPEPPSLTPLPVVPLPPAHLPSTVPPALPSTPTVRGRPVPGVRPSKLSKFMGGTVPVVATRSAAVPRPTTPVHGTPTANPGEEVACLYCTRPLPGGRAARYCPWCGQHLLARCRMCRSSLEESWIFCITCGHPT